MCGSCSTCLYATPARYRIPSCRHHTHCAPTAPANTLPVDTTALLETQHVKVVGKKVTGEQNAAALAPLVCKHPFINPSSRVCKKGRDSQAAKAKREKRSLHKDLFIAAMDCRTVGDMHPKEMIINNISSQQCNEVYMVIKPACKLQE